MLSFLNQKPLFHKDGAQRKPIEALPKKPQVVSIHARTLNINYHFSQTSAAKVLTKSGTQRQISSAIKFSRSKTVQKYAALLMSPFYRQHFLRILIKITMHTCVNILWQDSLINHNPLSTLQNSKAIWQKQSVAFPSLCCVSPTRMMRSLKYSRSTFISL